MRTLLWLNLALAGVLGFGCAEERDYYAPERSPITPPYEEDEDAAMPIDPGGPHQPNPDAATGPSRDAQVRDAGTDADARVDSSRDARVDANWDADADWISDADAYVDPDADFVDPDASDLLPPWDLGQPDEQGPVSLAVDCPTPPPTPPAPGTCRAWPWHTPACYRTPVECAALHESSYCLSIADGGSPTFTGLDTGARCAATFFPDYHLTANDNNLAQLGGDIFTTDEGVLVKHSLADGSFDVAPRYVNAAFVMGQQLVLLMPEGPLLAYSSWRDVVNDQNGQTLGNVSPATGAVFGANSKTIVAAWPSGRLDLFTPNVSARILRVQGYLAERDGAFLAADLSEDGSVIYLLTRDGIWTVNGMTGAVLHRRYAPSLQGLSCSTGLPPSASVPPTPGEPRPGFYYGAERADTAILSSSDCAGPYNGPRYYGQSSGPELLVISTFFNNDNLIIDERTTPHVLVLTAINGATWNVRVAADAMLERILISGAPISGLNIESSSGNPIPVEYHVDDPSVGGASLGSAAGSWPALDQAMLRENLERYTKRPLTELLGCHFGSTYTVRNVPPLCAP